MTARFAGFPEEAVKFFRALRRNNRREWFQPRKDVFERLVKAPMLEMIEKLNGEMLRFAPDYVTDPEKAMYRFYRDTRFSSDKTPYKDHVAASFWRRGFVKHHVAGYYFSVSDKECEVAGGVYLPPPDALHAIRQHIAAYHEEFRRLSSSPAVRRLVGELQGAQLTRVPKGFPPNHAAAGLLRYKQYLFYVTLDPALVTTPKLFTAVLQRFEAMAPWIEFLNRPLVTARQSRPAAAPRRG